MTRRRFWVYFLLLLFNTIAYVDRVNISVAGKPIAEELHLSPVARSYLKHLIEAAGGSMADIVKVTIFVADIKNRESVWEARQEFFTGNFPASTLVQVAALARPEIKVEIEAYAHIGASQS